MKRISFLFLLIVTTCSIALPAPAYLNIPAWKSCTSSIIEGNAEFVCLPKVQPDNCPSASWKLLQNQNLVRKCLK